MTKNPKTLFGMISSEKSQHYTENALKSFFVSTFLNPEDIFVLIDNDNSWTDFSWPNVNVIKNQETKSFAYNINQLLDIAKNTDSDLIVLSNDVVLTPNWREGLETSDDLIILPSCNQTFTYVDENKNPIFGNVVTLDQYLGNWEKLFAISQVHRNNNKGYFENLHMPFYLFRLPKKIYNDLGNFDENFHPAGGEDLDYRIRAIRKGYRTVYTHDSYVLHFFGKSTWHGAETDKEIQDRNASYYRTFVNKYSEDAALLFCQIGQPIEKINQVVENYKLNNSDTFGDIIKKLNLMQR